MRLRIGEGLRPALVNRRPIAHIAGAVGYASLANFNHEFKVLKGLTPRAYRPSFEEAR